MRRRLMILSVAVLVSLLYTSEGRSGGMAGNLFTTFAGPSFTATVVVNPDGLDSPQGSCPSGFSCPNRGTVAITLARGNTRSAAIFVSPVVALFENGCDGTRGALNATNEGVVAKTDSRFLGLDGWIPFDVMVYLLQPFGVPVNIDHPLVFSDLDYPVCTQVPIKITDGLAENAWILSFSGTMQFGAKKK